MKTKPIKARKMWVGTPTGFGLLLTDKRIVTDRPPVFVFPATREAYDQMVNQIAAVLPQGERDFTGHGGSIEWYADVELARKTLASIGVKRPTK